jgi:hypothetical protein
MPLPTKRFYLNDYILTGLIFISLFRWILLSRLLLGRLTAHLKGGWPGARMGQIEEEFLITYKVQTELIRILLSYTKRKMIRSATTLPNMKEMG